MAKNFMSYCNFSKMNFEISEDQKIFVDKIDDICKSLRSYEEKCYLKEKLNKKVISEFEKVGMLGCPISRKYGGLGYDIPTYILALERIGKESSSMRTFFSAHTSIGLLTVKNAEIYFDNCIVPKKNLLGQEGQGLNIAYSALIDGRLSVAAGGIGVMMDCIEECVNYSKKRKQHGSVLAKKQLIQEHIAKIAVNIESSRWLVYYAAHARQRLHDYVEKLKQEDCQWLSRLDRYNNEYSILRNEADRIAAIAKFHASNSAFDSANRAVQIFGSVAYRKTNRVARHFLDSRATMIYEGANEVLELKMASQILGEDYRAY